MWCSLGNHWIKGSVELYEKVSGYVSTRKRDSLTLREHMNPPEYACRPCISKRQHGVTEGQAAMI